MKVLLSGYVGRGNLGDEAIAASLIQGLKARGHQPLVLSGDPASTRETYSVPAYHRVRGIVQAVLQADAVVSGGGGLLQDKTSRRSLQYYLSVLQIAKRLGKPIFVFGQSLGPLTPQGVRQVTRVLRGVRVFVRDEPSMELLHRWGLEGELVTDAAFCLEPSEASNLDAPGVVLIPRGDIAGAQEALAGVARRLVEQNASVTVTPMDLETDVDAIHEIASVDPAITPFFSHDPRVQLDLVRRAELVVSVRLHGLIFATRVGTPSIGVAYDPKVGGFAEPQQIPLAGVPVNEQEIWDLVDATRSAREVEDPVQRETRRQKGISLARQADESLGQLDAALRAAVAG